MPAASFRLEVMPVPDRIAVEFNGATIADSRAAVTLCETRLPPVFYFPSADVTSEYLHTTDHHTNCPFKGNASYWDIEVAGRRAANAAWSYQAPYADAADLAGLVAFDWPVMDAWYRDGTLIDAQDPPVGGAANPYVDWVLGEAADLPSAAELVRSFGERMRRQGLPITQFEVLVRTLHPQVFAHRYVWRPGRRVEIFEESHEQLLRYEQDGSPYAPILRGDGGVRRALESEANPDFTELIDLKDRGATDYVAMPLIFSSGQINVVTLVTDRPGGFSTVDLGNLYEVLPIVSRVIELRAVQRIADSVARTYLGNTAGPRVLGGQVRRGDAEKIHAVIWFSDLRGSTALSEQLSPADYLAALNDYFDAMASAVIGNGGEILKFIGDAVMAVFRIDDPEASRPAAVAAAMLAVRDAMSAMDVRNHTRRRHDLPVLDYGIGLHRGDVMYGNVGAPTRLDFTVTGQAVNEASRIEGITKTAGVRAVVSAAVADGSGEPLIPLGTQQLRGVSAATELFTLPD